MELVIAIVLPFLAVLACAWIRFKPKFNLRPMPVLALATVLVGSVLGHEFFNMPAGPIPITLDRLLFGAMLAMFGLLFFLGREDLRAFNFADWTIIALTTVISCSTITHDFRFLKNMPASRLLFFNLMPVGLYMVLKTSKLKAGDLKFIAVGFGLFGLYLACTGIAEVKEFTAVIFPKYIMNSESVEFLGRGRGPFLNPVSNGVFQIVCFCCLLMWWPRSNNITKLLLIVSALVISVGVYATLTRSVWISLIAACGLFIWLPSSRQAKGAMIVLVTLLAVIAIPFSENFVSFKRDKDVSLADMQRSADLRPLFVLVAWDMFQDQPITGVGFGQYAREKYPYLQNPHTNKPLYLTKTFMQHNVFLAYVTETGLIGLACLLAMLGMILRVSWRVWRDSSLDLWARQFGLANLVLLGCYVINGMFHDVSILPMQHMLLFFMFGLVNNIYSKSSEFKTDEQAVPANSVDQPVSNVADLPNSGAAPVGC